MKIWNKRPVLSKSIAQLSVLAFFGVVVSTLAGGYLTDRLVRQEILRAEANRVTQLVNVFVNREFRENIWKDPSGAEAFKKYKKFGSESVFAKIGLLRKFEVWGQTGNRIWEYEGEGRDPGRIHLSEFKKKFQKGLQGEAQFVVESVPHGHPGKKDGENDHDAVFIALVPIWENGDRKEGSPSLLFEVHIESQVFFDEMDNLRTKVWNISFTVGAFIFLITMGGIAWIGRLHDTAARHASRMEIAGSIAKAVGSTLEPEKLFQAIVSEIRRAVPCARCLIASVNPETRLNHIWYASSELEPRRATSEETAAFGEWIHQHLYETNQPIYVNNLAELANCWTGRFLKSGFQSYLAIPILQDERAVAHIALMDVRQDAFSREQIDLLISITGQLSSAIRNASLYKTSNDRSVRLESLQKLNWQIAENLNLQKVLNSIVKAVVELLKGDFVNIYFAEEKDGILVSRCWGGDVPGPPPRSNGRNSFSIMNSVGGKVYRTSEPAIFEDVQQIPSWSEKEWVRKVGLHSFISQPLRHGGKNIGIINCMAHGKDFFGKSDLEFLSGLASQAAIAIVNARHHEMDTRRASRLETLQKITRKINENLGLPELLAAITEGSAELLDAKRVAVITVDNKNNVPEVLYKHGLSSDYMRSVLDHYKESTIPKAMRIMEPVAIQDVYTSSYALPHQIASDEGIGSLLSVPLLYKGASFGVLVLYWDSPREFSPVDYGLAQAFGDQAATAVQNAHLHEEAQRSRDFFKSIMDDNADAMMVSDENQKILRWNTAAEKLYGYSEAEMLGRPISSLVPEDCAEDIAVGKGIRIHGTEVVFDTYRLRKDGTRVSVSVSISPVKDECGKVIACCGIHKDLTPRRRQEEELRHARDEAEAATLAKSEFLANMSHEIRTPMNGVIGMTSLLLDTDLTEQQRAYAETLRSSGEGLLTVINDILDFSKIEAGKLTIDPVPIDLRIIVDEVIDLFSFRGVEKNLSLLFYFSPDVPYHLIGDSGRIRQILNNLVGNAIKFTEKGNVLIRVEAEAPESGIGNIRISVEDSGIGIPEEKISVIFDQFAQADASTTRKFGGSGLGLAISKHLSEVMGGTIGAVSKVGEGSTFWFTLDLPADPEEPSLSSPQALLDGVRVLIVDDRERERDVLCEQIGSWGMRPGGRGSAVDSLIALREANESGDPYEMIILDCDLPDMSGGDLARSIKNDVDFRAIPMVVMVPSFDRLKEKPIQDAGFTAYMIRPLRLIRLREVLDSVQEAKRAGKLGEPIPSLSLSAFAAGKESIEADRDRPIEARILVAEDNPVNQLVAKNMLESFGCSVDIVSNGKEAFDMHDVLHYDVIFMDCQMPEMDGYESTRNIRRREKENGGHIPIIAMTAHAMGDAREECLRAGMDDYISKPVKKEMLRDTLLQWVSGEESSAMDRGSEEIESWPDCAGEMEEESINLETLVQLKSIQNEGSPDIVEELLSLFVKDIPERFSVMRSSLDGNDSGAMKKVAHRLKGSCGQLGIVRMASLCETLEEKGEKENLEGAEVIFEILEREYEAVVKIISSKPWNDLQDNHR